MTRSAVLQDLADFRAKMDAIIADVGSGSLGIDVILGELRSEPHVSYLYAVKVLEADRRVGKVRARRLVGELGGEETTKIGQLNENQITEMLHRLAQWD